VESALETRIRELEDTLAKKDDEINYLEKLVAAHTSLEELSRRELVDAERTIEAQENLQLLLRQERQDSDALIKAQESLAQLSVMEKQSAEEVIRAHEQLHSLSRLEIQQADQTIRVQEEVSRMSTDEIQQRDLALRVILETGRQLAAILDSKRLFEGIASGLKQLLGTDRVAIFSHQSGNRLRAAELAGLSLAELGSPTCQSLRSLVEKAARSKTGCLETGALAVPLSHDGKLLGALYAARSDSQPLRPRDLEMAEIFSLQASVALHNAHLYQTIRKRNDELLRLVNIKETLTQRMTEEILGPVEAIDRALESMQGRPPLKDEMIKVKQASTRALRLLKRLCDMKALEEEASQIFADSIDFSTLVNGILERHDDKIKERNLSIRVAISDRCNGYRANEHIMRSVFDEVISNSIYYNRPGGSVSIQGRRAREQLVFVITDTGVGIGSEEIERIFEQFSRTENSMDLNPAGAGLGLFMVRIFLKSYGGHVEVKSTPGEGTKFTLTMLRH
jgi:signal transduction histidine kinase